MPETAQGDKAAETKLAMSQDFHLFGRKKSSGIPGDLSRLRREEVALSNDALTLSS